MGIKEIVFIIVFSKIVEKVIEWVIVAFKSRKKKNSLFFEKSVSR